MRALIGASRTTVVQLVAGNFRWLNLSGTRNTPAFPPISIN
jgi:hypothetical protein